MLRTGLALTLLFVSAQSFAQDPRLDPSAELPDPNGNQQARQSLPADSVLVLVDCSDGAGSSLLASRRLWMFSHLLDAIPDTMRTSVILYGHAEDSPGHQVIDLDNHALSQADWRYKTKVRLAVHGSTPSANVIYTAGAYDVSRSLLNRSDLSSCVVIVLSHALHPSADDRSALQNLQRTGKVKSLHFVAIPISTPQPFLDRLRKDVEDEDGIFLLARTHAEVTDALKEVVVPIDEFRGNLKFKTDSLIRRNQELTTDLEAKDQLIGEQVGQLTSIIEERAKLRGANSALTSDLAGVRGIVTQLNEANVQQKKTDGAKIIELTAAFENQVQINENKSVEIAGLVRVRDAQVASLAELKALVEAQVVSLKHLQAQFDSHRIVKHKEIECLTLNVKQLEATICKISGDLIDKTKALCECDKQLAVSSAKLTQTERERVTAVNDSAQKQKMIEKLTGENNGLVTKLSDTEKQRDILIGQSAEKQMKIDKLVAELALSNLNSTELASKLSQAEKQRDVALAESAGRQVRIAELQAEVTGLRVQLAGAQQHRDGPYIVSNDKVSNDKFGPGIGGAGGGGAASSSSSSSTGATAASSPSAGTNNNSGGRGSESEGDGFGDFLSTAATIATVVALL